MKKTQEYCDRCEKQIGRFDNIKPIGLFSLHNSSMYINEKLYEYGDLCKQCRKDANNMMKKFMNTLQTSGARPQDTLLYDTISERSTND